MVFQCKNCGGNVVYDPEKETMFCPYCDVQESEQKTPGTGANCVSCGGVLELTEYTSACKCKYCGNYNIIEERVLGEYIPHLVLPFKFGKKAAKEKIMSQFKKKRFLPSNFLSDASLEKMEGNYVPFFMYDYGCKYHFEGIGKKIRVWTSGNTEYTETSIFRIERNLGVDFAKIPVDASINMDDAMMDLIEPYDYTGLKEFKEEYLSGFLAERYNTDADSLSERAEKKARNDVESMAKKTLQGYNSIQKENEMTDLTLKDYHYSLLPVWSYQYKYGGKEYLFHLNGQTGKMVGEPPISYPKVFAYSATMFACLFTIFYFIHMILEVL